MSARRPGSGTPAVNVRLWVLVAVTLLLVPGLIVATRQLSGPARAAEGAAEHEAAREESAAAAPPASAARPAPEPAPPSPKPPSPQPTNSSPGASGAEPTSVPESGPARFRRAELSVKPASSTGRLIRYRVLVERNLDIDPERAAAEMAATLNDSRSWTGDGSVRFELVGAGSKRRTDLTIYLSTPGTTDRRCAPLLTRGEVSCQQGNSVNLNAKRWVQGVRYFGDDVTGYRRYLVNHEVGHYLGHGHVTCPGKGRAAPIMMQQTKGLDGCQPNPWVKASRR